MSVTFRLLEASDHNSLLHFKGRKIRKLGTKGHVTRGLCARSVKTSLGTHHQDMKTLGRRNAEVYVAVTQSSRGGNPTGFSLLPGRKRKGCYTNRLSRRSTQFRFFEAEIEDVSTHPIVVHKKKKNHDSPNEVSRRHTHIPREQPEAQLC